MAKKIAITGASSQIGQAISELVVKRLTSPGDFILLHGAKNTSACSVFNDMDVNIQVVSADFCDSVQLESFCAQLEDTDILINAAACIHTGLLPQLSSAEIDSTLSVNIRALIRTCQSVIPSMMVKRKGIIVNISSVAARRGNKGQSIYAGSKGFVESFTRAIAAEYGKRGICINAVAPGAIDAGSLKPLLSYAENEVRQSTVSPFLGAPADVAAAVVFLCSEEARFINGACLAVDGGFISGV